MFPVNIQQESRTVTSKPHNAARVTSCLKFADNIHYKFKSSQASKARQWLQAWLMLQHFLEYEIAGEWVVKPPSPTKITYTTFT